MIQTVVSNLVLSVVYFWWYRPVIIHLLSTVKDICECSLVVFAAVSILCVLQDCFQQREQTNLLSEEYQ
ncbi:hypothetical protein F2P81_023682 [Scophthalmus maximus]|uniref:Uncharacterized protein n=1 Tax=Scophthalmus maximus TaxID=52904 RepID=A0A6A4RVF5_SCOMX|nr:hypothetical protein F2P81_023682 [Scophthalmus maximus]